LVGFFGWVWALAKERILVVNQVSAIPKKTVEIINHLFQYTLNPCSMWEIQCRLLLKKTDKPDRPDIETHNKLLILHGTGHWE